MYVLDDRYRDIAEDIIDSVPELAFLSDIKIAFLSCDTVKISHGHLIHGDCRKVSEIYGAMLPYSFIITVYEPNCEGFDDMKYRILIEHELRHIGMKNGEPCVVPHDIELGEFRAIGEKYGYEWDVK